MNTQVLCFPIFKQIEKLFFQTVLGILILVLSAKFSLLASGYFVALTGHVGALCLLCLLFPFAAVRNATYGYLAAYLSGLPVASAPFSLSIFSPILGYLIGFCLFVEVFHVLSKRISLLLSLLASLATLYLVGYSFLCFHLPFTQAFLEGVAPFILVDLAKVLFVFFTYKGWKRVWEF